jgi:hypothetical protein
MKMASSVRTAIVSSDGATCSVRLSEEDKDKGPDHNADSDMTFTYSSGETFFHLAVKLGREEVPKKETYSNYKYENGNTPLHLAAMSRSADSVKNLIENGADLLVENKNKHTALDIILNNIPSGENILMEILNENIYVTRLDGGKEKLEVSLRVLCPEDRNPMAVADRLFTRHRENQKLLRHPLLKTLIHLKWKHYRYFMWCRAFVFFFYLLLLTFFVFYQDGILATFAKSFLGPFSVNLILFCHPYFMPGHYSWKRRISKILLFGVPPFLTLISVSIRYNAEWCGVSYLFSWLSIPLYCTPFHVISHQAGMFIFVTREIFKHCAIFFFVLAGFSITFYVLYHDISAEKYKNFWYTFLHTSLVLLQGDSLGEYNMIKTNNTADATANHGYVTYITETMSAFRFASIITSILFVLLVIIALLNMLVALAVRGGNELVEYGQIYHLWNQTHLLYEWHEVKKFFSKYFPKCQPQNSKKQLRDQDECHKELNNKHLNGENKITIEDRHIPRSVRNELVCIAKSKGEKKGFNPSENEMESVVKEKIPVLLRQIQEWRDSLLTELKCG